ncbi:hypothetical protein [Actinoallomurus sp. NPDC050550]|uniref:hypothetical protein n=1 Tax=Actinoallomurus sp. NPDC050550 TaxID=3154937 RepID=UPI0033F72A02
MSDDQGDRPGAGRWATLPPRVRLQDTVAVQETPPKPQVVLTPDDPLREATTVGG